MGTECNRCRASDPAPQMTFERREVKYLLDSRQVGIIMASVSEHMVPDEHGHSEVRGVYYDTPSMLLARRSIDHPAYKEKLRMRAYGDVTSDGDMVFVEVKKKLDGITYKRRCSLPLSDAIALTNGTREPESQVEREIAMMLVSYPGLSPRVRMSYGRESFYGSDSRDMRVTFDSDVFYSTDVPSMLTDASSDGIRLLPAGTWLMETKSGGALPLWMCSALDDASAHPSGFSKYGRAYMDMVARGYDASAQGCARDACNDTWRHPGMEA